MPHAAPLEVRVLPIGKLRPARYNPRKVLKVTDAAYRRLRASLEEFGLVEPLIWNELTGRVVGGHARLRILKELEYTEVPVSVVRLDEAREKALNVVLNNHEAQGRYDPTKLEKLLTQLEDLPEFGLTGFDARTLTNLRLEPVAELPPEVRPDRVEVMLVTDPATWTRLEGRLDELVREFDLEAHVRRG
jgi:ParB-like chromosome segregation protein Spo0J